MNQHQRGRLSKISTWAGFGAGIQVIELVNLVLEKREQGDVAGKGDEGEKCSKEGHERGEQSDGNVLGKGHQEGNECHSSRYQKAIRLYQDIKIVDTDQRGGRPILGSTSFQYRLSPYALF